MSIPLWPTVPTYGDNRSMAFATTEGERMTGVHICPWTQKR
eukprot:CAMPEP_0179027350 /NCGR_PEP_ID=MMETSP0796-20121207/8993_1 /TAXON_ID=73915 /ORGANISM="Pyrodinium bahamense, Strain pbaha01" /LENGTH=40 /DNA_ID= /DNA_START= /DNA_END= /DNA_ORIENTATION=